MSETTEACARGCSLYRQHLTDCEDGDECSGCLPRRAQYGRLCHTCHRRLELMLFDAPTVVNWLTGNLATGGTASDDPHVTGSRDLPLPIKAAIFDERQAMCDALSVWADDIAETLGVTGPLSHTAEHDARFLLTWLSSIERMDPIGDWWEELAEHTSNAHALAPWRPAMRRIRRVPCPRCGETNLGIFGGESDITCLSCRAMMTEDQFELWQTVLRMDTEADAG